MYQTGNTIRQTLDEVAQHQLVLPAIQREFVWRPDQICRLFDSLLQGYPFGTFLYWRVAAQHSARFKFFDFVRNYHQRNNPHCPPLDTIHDRQLTAVLDGQQRLTALNIGLRGSMAWKRPRYWWSNPDAFPKRTLHLDLLWRPDEDDEESRQYRFQFLTDTQVEQARARADGSCWFLVPRILEMRELERAIPEWTPWLLERMPPDELALAQKALIRLRQVVHTERLIAYYEEQGQELDRALQIFIRMNDGGTPLSHSDLLLSIAVAQWRHHGARREIHALVDELNRIGTGFSFSKDLVLKAGLMLSDIGRVGFKVDNFNRENMDTFERNWNRIKRALLLTAHLVASFGFSGQNLAAHNSLLPIAYYLYRKNPGEGFLVAGGFDSDRAAIREWLIRSLLKSGVWGSGLDSLLTGLRQTIRESGHDRFPAERIGRVMARRGRELTFNEEEIEDLVDMRIGDHLTFSLLSLLFPFVDLRNQFHVDHIFPAAAFGDRGLLEAGVPEDKTAELKDRRDRLGNLQLLPGQANIEKQAKLPAVWLEDYAGDEVSRREYAHRHLMDHLPASIAGFSDFYEMRRRRLKSRLLELLGAGAESAKPDRRASHNQ